MAATSFVETHGLRQLVLIGVLHIRLGKSFYIKRTHAFNQCMACHKFIQFHVLLFYAYKFITMKICRSGFFTFIYAINTSYKLYGSYEMILAFIMLTLASF